MTLTDLRYLVALARERHFGHAAERCHVSQPTLSVAIKNETAISKRWDVPGIAAGNENMGAKTMMDVAGSMSRRFVFFEHEHRVHNADPQLPLKQRWRRMLGPKGYRPPRQWWAFVRAHAPRPKAVYWLAPYVLFGLESVTGGRVRLRRNVRRPMKVT